MRPMFSSDLLCPLCGSDNVKASRWRSSDLGLLLLLRRPVRCHECSERFYASVFTRSEPRSRSEHHSEMVLRIRVRNPGRLLLALLLRVGEPMSEPRLE